MRGLVPAAERSGCAWRDASFLLMALSGSSRSPNVKQCVGHTDTHAGAAPSFTRCAQKVHLSAYPSGWTYRASYGHDARHALHPMHSSCVICTSAPNSSTWLAPVGQQVTHGGLSQ